MEIRLHALALIVQRVHFVAAAVLLDAPHLPALFLEQRGKLFLRLPAFAAAGVAGGEAGRACGHRGKQCAGQSQRDEEQARFHGLTPVRKVQEVSALARPGQADLPVDTNRPLEETE